MKQIKFSGVSYQQLLTSEVWHVLYLKLFWLKFHILDLLEKVVITEL